MPDTPDSLVTIDLTGPESAGGKVGRILIGTVLLVVFGALALACGIVWAVGGFIPFFIDGWDWAIELAPFVGAIFLGLAILGFELLRRGRKARASDYQALTTVLEATGLAEAEANSAPTRTPPTTPLPPTVV